MLNTPLAAHLGQGALGVESFVKPHPLYNFGRIPATVRHLLGLPTAEGSPLPPDTLAGNAHPPFDKVVTLFIDALGWRFVEPLLKKDPLLKRLQKEGTLSMITSQFPSTTAVHATTMKTGLTGGQHGIPEFNYYEPILGEVFNALKTRFTAIPSMSPMRDNRLGAVYNMGGAFSDSLAYHDIPTFSFEPETHLNTPFNETIDKRTSTTHYTSPAQGLELLRQKLENHKGPGYFAYYDGFLDKLAHQLGPDHAEVKTHASDILGAINERLIKGLQSPRTAFLLFADHGQTAVDPQQTYYIDSEIQGINDHLRTNKHNFPHVYTGSNRDMFLYVKPEFRTSLGKILRRKLPDDLILADTQRLLGEGYFGSTVGRRLLERLPDFIILPTTNRSVWWNLGRNPQKGMHGGLSREEMLIPFGFLPC